MLINRKILLEMATKRKKEPIHKIFYVCSAYTPDADWSEFLKECSFGKFPRGVRFENGAIKCTRKKQTFTEFLPKDTEKALQVMLEVFRDRLKIKTSKDQKSEAVSFERKKEECRIQTWKEATTIAAKTTLIRSFANRFVLQYFLSEKEHTELLLLLNLAITTKTLDGTRIHMQDGRINMIDGLNFDPFTRQLTLDGSIKKHESLPITCPLHFVAVPQVNYQAKYGSLVEYHTIKYDKARSP